MAIEELPLVTEAPQPYESSTSGTNRSRPGLARRFVANVLPPLALGAILIGLWYFISFGILDSRRQFLGRMLTVAARIFIDASYEGDLMAKAGVTYHVGREGNEVYRETLNGVHSNAAGFRRWLETRGTHDHSHGHAHPH